jgi:hypothetical protein
MKTKILIIIMIVLSALSSQSQTYSYLGGWDNKGLPDYLVNSDTLLFQSLTYINQVLPE